MAKLPPSNNSRGRDTPLLQPDSGQRSYASRLLTAIGKGLTAIFLLLLKALYIFLGSISIALLIAIFIAIGYGMGYLLTPATPELSHPTNLCIPKDYI
jgi:hypothetical protein